jgi:hypothetical protein
MLECWARGHRPSYARASDPPPEKVSGALPFVPIRDPFTRVLNRAPEIKRYAESCVMTRDLIYSRLMEPAALKERLAT